jgi:hypothetical protein
MLPGSRERWTKRLNRNEYEILYYLYEIRNKQQIREYFKNRIEDSEIEEIMAQHRKLGTIIQTRDSYLSVANFPEYWKMH